MPGAAYDAVKNFWDKQDSRDYVSLVDLFTDDAVAEDEAVGSFHGKEAITNFMTQMAEQLPKRGIHFDVVEICGDDETAWAKWKAVYADGRTFDGVGVYKVRDGKIAYYRDYHAIPQE